MKTFISLASLILFVSTQIFAQWSLLTQPRRPVAHYKASLHNWVLIEDRQHLFVTKNAGQSWQNVTTGLPENFEMPSVSIREAWMFGLEMYTGQFMRYDFTGNAWIPFGSGLPEDGFKRDFIDAGMNMLLIHLDPFYSHGKVYRSSPDGTSWQISHKGLPEYFEASHLMKAGNRLAVAGFGGVFYSDDQGKSWKNGNNGVMEGCQIQYLLKNNGNLVYTFDDCYNTMISIDGGASWSIANGLPPGFYASGIAAIKGRMVLSGCCNHENPTVNNFFYSMDEGKNWKPYPAPFFPNNQSAGNVVRVGDLLYAAGGHHVYRSTDIGKTWELVDALDLEYLSEPELIADGFRMYVAGDGGFLLSDDKGITWKERSHLAPQQPFSLQYVWANKSVVLGSSLDVNRGLFRSDDKGQTWTFDPEMAGVTCIAETAQGIFASTWRGGNTAILKSTDKGLTWQLAGKGLDNASQLWTIMSFGNDLYAGGLDGVYASFDGGNTWELRNSGMGANYLNILSLAYDEVHKKLYAGSWHGSIYVSSDQGLSWKVIAEFPAASLKASIGSIYAWNGEAILYSHDGGANWSISSHAAMTAPQTLASASIIARGKTVIVGAAAGVFKSEDGAVTWQFFSNGLPDDTHLPWLASSLASDHDYLYVACLTEGIYRRPFSSMTTDTPAEQELQDRSVTITPNPANQHTTVQFDFPETSQLRSVQLVNYAGQILYSGSLDSTEKGQLAISTGELPSGIYTLKIVDGNQAVVRRLLVQH
jgi:photosystem II stability/assembly factor-like uncharacterized protein